MERAIYIVQSQNRIILSKPSSVLVNSKYIDLDRLDANFYRTDVIELATKIESRFRMKRAEDLFEIITDGDHGTREYVSQGIPFYTAINVQEYGFVSQTDLFITKEYEESLKRSRLEENCLLIVKTGVGTGTSCVTGKNVKEGNISADVGIFKNPKQEIDIHLISAFMNSKSGREFILRSSYGSTRNRLTIAELKNLKLPIPSIKIQNYIGNKVRKAEELRERAKKNRREYTSLIDNYFSNVSKDKFPKGSFIINCQNIDSESQRLDASFYNPIYKEYENLDIEYKKLGDLVKAKTNINPKSDVDYFYYEIGDMSNNVILDKEETIKGKNLPSRAKLNLSKYDIIVSLVQESIEVISFVDIDRENMLTTNGCAVLAPKDISIAGYLYAIVSSPYFIAQKCRYISGTNIRSLSKEDLLQIPIPIFEYKIIEKINDLVKDEYYSLRLAKQLIREAKQDVEDLIEGKFDESKISEGV